MSNMNRSSRKTLPIVNDGDGQFHLKCFGCCCDFRKAVITADVIMLGLYAAEMIRVGVMMGATLTLQILYMIALGAEVYPGAELLFAEAFLVIGIVFYCIGILGALYFNECALVATSVYYSIIVFFSVMTFDKYDPWTSLAAIIIHGSCLYLHGRLLILMDKGIMTAEKYHRSCKCSE